MYRYVKRISKICSSYTFKIVSSKPKEPICFQKVSSKYVSDKNNDGEVSASELTSGAEKAFKVVPLE